MDDANSDTKAARNFEAAAATPVPLASSWDGGAEQGVGHPVTLALILVILLGLALIVSYPHVFDHLRVRTI